VYRGTRNARALAALIPAAALVLAGLPATAAPGLAGAATSATTTNQVDTTSRSAVRRAYLDRWLPGKLAVMALSGGSTSSCQPFTTSAARQQATADAINLARGLVGESAIHFTAKYNDLAARVALMMAANGTLSHDPPRTWSCWTQAGHDAAARSNIALSSTVPTASGLAELYLDDAGASNTAVGHRRWLLRPEATSMGSGNAQGSWFGNALYVITFADDNAKAPARPYYAWPSAGWFPDPLEPDGRWSLSSSTGASFANAQVTVTGPGGASLPLTRRPVATGYGDNTLVWDLRTPPPPVIGVAAPAYTVKVTGIKGGASSTYSYRVQLFDPTVAVETPTVAPPAQVVSTTTRLKLSTLSAHVGSTRVKVTMTTTAANGSYPAGTLVLWRGGSRYGSYSLSAADQGVRTVTLTPFGTKGQRAVYVAFQANASYARSTARAVVTVS
jgi:hypothetical protein